MEGAHLLRVPPTPPCTQTALAQALLQCEALQELLDDNIAEARKGTSDRSTQTQAFAIAAGSVGRRSRRASTSEVPRTPPSSGAVISATPVDSPQGSSDDNDEEPSPAKSSVRGCVARRCSL